MVSISNRIMVSREIRFKLVIVGLIVLVSCLGVYVISGMQGRPNDGTWIDLSESRQKELIDEWKSKHLDKGESRTQDENRKGSGRILQKAKGKLRDFDQSKDRDEAIPAWPQSSSKRNKHHGKLKAEGSIPENHVDDDRYIRNDISSIDKKQKHIGAIRKNQGHSNEKTKNKYGSDEGVQKNVPSLVKSPIKSAYTGGRAEYPSILQDDNYTRNCITGEIIGHVLPGNSVRNITLMSQSSVEDHRTRVRSFQKIFKTAAWGGKWDSKYQGLSSSGRGSTLYWAQETLFTLNLVVYALKHKLRKKRIKVLDIPCGDMQWMSRFLKTRDDIDYTGIDIVPDIIKRHRKTYKQYPWKFKVLDIVDNALDDTYDLIISRALLQHLYFEDAVKVLKHLSDSRSLYLITSTFPRTELNSDLNLKDNPGRTRHLNLELPPLSLTSPLCLQRDGPPEVKESWEHYLSLWKLPLRQTIVCQSAKEYFLPRSRTEFYTCSNVYSMI